MVEHADLGKTDRLLDVGCGLGAALQHAARTGARVAGIDPSARRWWPGRRSGSLKPTRRWARPRRPLPLRPS
ncbi:MAG TPA: methyltransferase domain-containing protein [Acidimicrobiia bacterium]|nr:methyltransferase domain-containing protein [Acidimicrobiia bacterium]